MVKNWLITGGCGFIGGRVIARLLSQGDCRIRVIDNLTAGKQEDLEKVCKVESVDAKAVADWKDIGAGSCQLIVGDILNAELALSLCAGADVILHLAGNTGVGPSVENPKEDLMNNVLGTFHYLEAARHNQVSRFVFASSGAPVGEVEPPIHEELAPHPVSPYGASKLACEGYCSAYFRSFGVESVVLRFSNVYGPGSNRKSSVVAKFIRQALAGEQLEIYGDGEQTRDYIYIEDLVSAILRAASLPNIGGEIFQIATGRETTLNQLAQLLDKEMKAQQIQAKMPIHGSPRLGDVKRNFSDTRKAKEKLGWIPQMPLEEGLAITLRHLASISVPDSFLDPLPLDVLDGFDGKS